METIIDDIEDRTEVFEITDTPPKNISSFDDLMNHIEYQFTPNPEIEVDNYDYEVCKTYHLTSMPFDRLVKYELKKRKSLKEIY